jgi:hypothetical protein
VLEHTRPDRKRLRGLFVLLVCLSACALTVSVLMIEAMFRVFDGVSTGQIYAP